jgi:hypothetical protein
MQRFQVRLIGRKPDHPQSIVLRDEEGRYFLRPACGSRAVRITARDAERLMRQYRYDFIEDPDWHSSTSMAELGCQLPPIEVEPETIPVQ